MSERHNESADSPDEELPEFDFADPLKRNPEREDESMPGLDPMITIPPED
jgi:hypothetical protein